MLIQINIEEETFRDVITSEVMRAIQNRARDIVGKRLHEINSQVDVAVMNYLEKKLTAEDIKKKIDDSVATLIKERLDDGY